MTPTLNMLMIYQHNDKIIKMGISCENEYLTLFWSQVDLKFNVLEQSNYYIHELQGLDL